MIPGGLVTCYKIDTYCQSIIIQAYLHPGSVTPNLIFLLLKATRPELRNALPAPPDPEHDDLENFVLLYDDMGLVHQTGWDVLLVLLKNIRVVTVLQGLR